MADTKYFRDFLAQVKHVPRGKVVTYGDVAYAAGHPGMARQVAWALHKSRGLPWHRVLGAGGQILLPGEAGFEQRMRLQAEGVEFRGLRVNIDAHRFAFFPAKKKKSSTQRAQRKRRK